MKIKEFANIISGSTPKTGVPEYWDGELLWITPAEIKDDDVYISDTKRKITIEGVKSASLKEMKQNTILLTSRAPIGKVAIVDKPMYCNQGFKNLECDEEIVNPKYLYYWLSSRKEYLNDLGRGATFKEISKGIVGNIDVPIYDISTQAKIVEVLDKSKKMINNRKEQMEILDKLIQSTFYSMFGDPIKNNKDLPTIELRKLGDWKSGGTPSRKNPNYYTGKIPWLSSGELNQKYTYDSIERVTTEAIEESSAKIIESGSLLLGMYDTAALKSTINRVECACNQAIAFSKIDESLVITEFVYHCIQIGIDYYKSQQRGVRQKNLNLSMIKGIEILKPSMDSQIKFIEIVNKIEIEKELLKQSLEQLEINFKALEQKAFNGELFN